MKYINETKAGILGGLGLIGTFISKIFGGWDSAMTTLVIFMVADYVAGLVVAGVFKKSGKSENGALNSNVGWKGLCKKGMTLVIVLVAHRLDLSLDTEFIKDAAIIGYIVNELLSIVENIGLMGVYIPPAISQAIDVLRKKGDTDANSNR
jgi:toxin secretion/phage lysis holin